MNYEFYEQIYKWDVYSPSFSLSLLSKYSIVFFLYRERKLKLHEL